MDSRRNDPKGPGFPIRKSTDQSLLAAPRSLSQRATSFIASWCQGIHQMPLRRLIFVSRHAQGQALPMTVRPSFQDPTRPWPATRRHAARECAPTCREAPASPRQTNLSTMKNNRPHRGPRPAAANAETSNATQRTGRGPRGLSGDDGRAIHSTKFPAGVCPARPRRMRGLALNRGAMVEVNGFEPMTSCLQSRRSPN